MHSGIVGWPDPVIDGEQQVPEGGPGDTSYESPQFGYEVEWDDPWFIELQDYPEGSLGSDPPAGVDDIHEILLEYLDTLAEASDVFTQYARADDDAEQDELGDQFDQLIEDAYDAAE